MSVELEDVGSIPGREGQETCVPQLSKDVQEAVKILENVRSIRKKTNAPMLLVCVMDFLNGNEIELTTLTPEQFLTQLSVHPLPELVQSKFSSFKPAGELYGITPDKLKKLLQLVSAFTAEGKQALVNYAADEHEPLSKSGSAIPYREIEFEQEPETIQPIELPQEVIQGAEKLKQQVDAWKDLNAQILNAGFSIVSRIEDQLPNLKDITEIYNFKPIGALELDLEGYDDSAVTKLLGALTNCSDITEAREIYQKFLAANTKQAATEVVAQKTLEDSIWSRIWKRLRPTASQAPTPPLSATLQRPTGIVFLPTAVELQFFEKLDQQARAALAKIGRVKAVVQSILKDNNSFSTLGSSAASLNEKFTQFDETITLPRYSMAQLEQYTDISNFIKNNIVYAKQVSSLYATPNGINRILDDINHDTDVIDQLLQKIKIAIQQQTADNENVPPGRIELQALTQQAMNPNYLKREVSVSTSSTKTLPVDGLLKNTSSNGLFDDKFVNILRMLKTFL
ncbi:hypothetical protein KA082_02730 [Candidatus Woesebacteria bacterium]|nr:hypothetical protein [Candidatus Woesebacteria bacterium]